MSRWFRHYAGMCRDDKLVRVALRSKQSVERVVWVFAAILESASEVNDGGRYDLDAEEAAYFLRADVLDIQNIEHALRELGRLDEGRVAKWGDRQFLSDNSAERVRSYRERKKGASVGGEQGKQPGNAPHMESERPCDGDVTLQKRSGNAPETETETQPQSDKTSSDVLERMARKPAKAVRAKARTAIAPDQQPTIDDARPAHAAGMRGDDMRHEWQKFRDFHLSRGSLMADWSAAWRTWCGNFGKFGAPARAGSKPQQGDFMASVLSGKWRKDLDEQHSSEHQSDQSSGRTEPAWGGSDRALPEPGGDDSGGPLLDLRVVGARWT